MKCLPFSENAPVMISVMASSDGIVLRQKKNILFVIKNWKFCGGSTKRHNNVTQPPHLSALSIRSNSTNQHADVLQPY